MKLKKHTLNLTDGAWDELRRLFPDKDTSTVVRQIIDLFIEKEKMKDKSIREIKLMGVDL